MNIEFKPIPDQEIAEALQLLEVFSQNGENITMDQRIEAYQKAKKYNSYQLYGGYEENKLQAVVGIRPVHNPSDCRLIFEANNLVVVEDQQKQGIGSFMFEKIGEHVKDQGGFAFKFFVANSNLELVDFYEKRGAGQAACQMMYLKV